MKRASVLVVALAAALCMALVLCGCSSTSYEPEKKSTTLSSTALKTDGTLRVGVDASSIPYAGESQGNIVGLNVDLASAIADELGLSVEFVDVGTNVESAFTQENVDIVMGADAKEGSYWTSEPYIESAIVLFSKDATAKAPASGSGTFAIAAQSSSMSAWQVTDHYGSKHLKSEMDLKVAFQDLESGAVDFVAADYAIGAYVANNAGVAAYPVATLQEPTSERIAVASTNTALQTAVKNALSTLDKGGMIKVVERKWLGTTVDLSGLPEVTAKSDEGDEGAGTASSSTNSVQNGVTTLA